MAVRQCPNGTGSHLRSVHRLRQVQCGRGAHEWNTRTFWPAPAKNVRAHAPRRKRSLWATGAESGFESRPRSPKSESDSQWCPALSDGSRLATPPAACGSKNPESLAGRGHLDPRSPGRPRFAPTGTGPPARASRTCRLGLGNGLGPWPGAPAGVVPVPNARRASSAARRVPLGPCMGPRDIGYADHRDIGDVSPTAMSARSLWSQLKYKHRSKA
jgi:hypothetical protein